MDKLWQEIQFVKGVGPQRARLLNKLNIYTVFDLLWDIPRAYFNRQQTDSIDSLQNGAMAAVKGQIIAKSSSRTRRKFQLTKVMIENDSGRVGAVWFNQSYLSKSLEIGQQIFITGRVRDNGGFKEIQVSEHEVIDPEEPELPVAPIYHLTDGLKQKIMRKIISSVLNDYLPYYQDIFDEHIIQRYHLADIHTAFLNIHFPSSGEAYLRARRRLAFEELFLFKLLLAQMQGSSQSEPRLALAHPPTNLYQEVEANLPFTLTGAQMKAMQDITDDLNSSRAMNRLLQGDVGSGKTVVAALAMAHAVSRGQQVALMVPTEILAEQHFASLQDWFAGTKASIACLTGGVTDSERTELRKSVASGQTAIVVGTQALIQETVKFQDLGLIVIDEQHRFGVRQRGLLGLKGQSPHILTMTATPIPRTLALALYGDLHTSVIDEMPPGRRPVKTVLIPGSSRSAAYDMAEMEISQGAQVYVICPLVEESENQDLLAAVNLHRELSAEIFPELRVGLLHGRMKTHDKENVMNLFKQGEIDLLVTTTVVEVGVDVPRASVIIIEHAERFGLSQLHQLRGRVGRGQRQSFCLLVAEAKTEDARLRLQAMEKTHNGFELANYDLAIRGPGDFWGVKQHGLDELKVARLLKDQKILAWADKEVVKYQIRPDQEEMIESYIQNKFKTNIEMPHN